MGEKSTNSKKGHHQETSSFLDGVLLSQIGFIVKGRGNIMEATALVRYT